MNSHPLSHVQKTSLSSWSHKYNGGTVYYYRDWQNQNGYYSGFIRTWGSKHRHEYGLHLYEDGMVKLVSTRVLDELEEMI